VSDAGAPFDSDSAFGPRIDKQVLRALDITTSQSRGLRKRALINDYVTGVREGTYWGIMTHIAKYGPPAGALNASPQKIDELAGIRTRLNKFNEREQCELMNWGYAVCDAAMRRDVLAKQPPGTQIPQSAWPYPTFPL
jgi:NTE family protein